MLQFDLCAACGANEPEPKHAWKEREIAKLRAQVVAARGLADAVAESMPWLEETAHGGESVRAALRAFSAATESGS